MRRTTPTIALASLSSLLVLTGCPGEEAGTSDPVDGGPALPDAVVIVPIDAGPIDATIPEPTVNSVSPGSGPTAGGTRVTIRGSSFTEPIEVWFGGAQATSVVVLDEVSVAATTPAAPAPGPVSVKIATAGGVGDLPNGFRYHRELAVTQIEPARIPEEGGVPLVIRGKGFDQDTLILFDREPLIGARVIDAERIEGFAPALRPGRPLLQAMNTEAQIRRGDLLVVFATPEIDAIAPAVGPIAGGAEQALAGSGFEGLERVEIGGQPATELQIVTGSQVSVRAPALAAEGVYDVNVANADATFLLPAAYVAVDPRRAGLQILGVIPARASKVGGQSITVVGYGMTAGARVEIQGVSAVVTRVDPPHVIVATVPAGLTVGPKDVQVRIGGQVALAGGALAIYEPMTVASISPERGPAAGGTEVAITGHAFLNGVRDVRIGDVPLADRVVENDTIIRGKVQAGAHGKQDVRVLGPDGWVVLEDAFTFDEPFQVIRLDPVEGSIAGNTFVSVYGRGFTSTATQTETATLTFGSNSLEDPRIENGSVISARTMPDRSGRVDVEVITGAGSVKLEDAYRFYDPRIITGGVWGGPVEGSVNVAVLEPRSGGPVPGMLVQLGYDADLRYAAITDENGLATISGPEIMGPQTVTVGRTEWEFVTFQEVDARNLTMFSSPYPKSPPPDEPVPPCPMGGEAPTIRGKVYKFKSSLDPVTRPGWRPLAIVTTSQQDLFNPNPPMPPEQVDYVTSDGEEYEIVVTRAGTVTVYALLGDYNEMLQEFIPRKLGLARQIPSAPGQIVEDVNIALEIDLDKTVRVRLDRPPVQLPGPSANVVEPYLNLGNEGVIQFPSALFGEATEGTLTGLPNVIGARFYYLAGSFTDQDGQLGAPYSLSLAEATEEDDDGGVDLGPFLNMPEDVSPKAGEVARGGRFAWRVPGQPPDLTRMFAVDVTAVAGCCCFDLNMNGSCEEEEPQQCGGGPVQFDRWSVFGPGDLQSYAMPRMPNVVKAFDAPNSYFWAVMQAIAPRFSYNEFIVNQYSPYFWKSWTFWYSQFLAKEETD